jgi:phage nucleotide-binding protein
MAGKPRAIQALSDYTESLNVLIYADSGAGKTVLCGTAPRALFLATEPGTISAKKQGSKAEVWPIDSHAELMKAHKWLEENPGEYDWVLLDGLTNLQEILWRESIEKGRAINPDRDADILAQQDYLRVQNQIKEVVRLFNDLPQNVVYTAQTMRAEDDEDEVLMLPLLSGKKGEFAQKLCGMVHVVGYLTVITPKSGNPPFRRLHTQREGKIFAKDRYDAIGRLDKPTIPKIAEKIEASITENAQPTKPAAKAAPRKGAARKTRRIA